MFIAINKQNIIVAESMESELLAAEKAKLVIDEDQYESLRTFHVLKEEHKSFIRNNTCAVVVRLGNFELLEKVKNRKKPIVRKIQGIIGVEKAE